MSIHKSASRIHVTGRLSQGDSITLSKDQSHYLIRVMRRSPGDTVIVFNGRDGEWQTSIDQSSKSSCTLLIDHQLRPQSNEPDIWLAFAPIKKTRLDFLIEKATELGVSKLLPVITHHTDVGRINRDRLQATAIEASEQCERLSIPTVEEAVSFDQLLEHWPENRRLLYLDETGQGDPLAVIINQNSTDGVLDGIFVGPEGGFSSSELEVLQELSFSCAGTLGPRILRAETAALSALTIWQSIAGDTCRKRNR
mgnify:CR=1 FL=1